MTDMTEQHHEGSTRAVWDRRFTYGANVAVLILAVLVIVVLLNWLAAIKVRQWGISARFDLTATRKYTLSPQTRKVLTSLDDPVRIVTLFAGGAADAQTARRISDFRELLDEYEYRSSGKVEVEHLDAVSDIAAYEQLAAELRLRYRDEIGPVEKAIDSAVVTLKQIDAFAAERGGWFKTRQPILAGRIDDPGLRQFFNQVAGLVPELPKMLELEDRLERIDDMLAQPLPDYQSTKQTAREPLTTLRDGLLKPGITGFVEIAKAPDAPADLKQFCNEARQVFDQLSKQVDAAIESLDAAAAVEYDATRRNIREADSAVVMAEGGLTVIRLDDVYTAPIASAEGGDSPEQRFRGEEAVTGAVISLTLEVKPLVVFVIGQQPAVGPQGAYTHVAERLTNMNFEVTEWAPAGRQTQFGPMPPQPRPEPEEGQPAVWVFVPSPPPDPRMPYNPAKQQIDRAFNTLVDQGANVLVFMELSPMVRFGQPDAMATLIGERFGVNVDLGTQIITSVVTGDGREIAAPQIDLSNWPTEHPISAAIQGQPGVLLNAVPMTAEPTEGVETWPLIRTSEDAWGETDAGMTRNPKREADEQSGPLVAGITIQKGEQRAVVIGDAYFANDQVTQYGPVDFFTGRTISVTYPANAELFTNSVYWLSGMDQLIATGARTQDVRRFEPISDAQRTALWWIVLAGLPVLTLASGVGVWLIRRQ
jgi:hypothetical protein